jgi:hypothetical protein
MSRETFFDELFERSGDPQHFGAGLRKGYSPEDESKEEKDETAEKSESD